VHDGQLLAQRLHPGGKGLVGQVEVGEHGVAAVGRDIHPVEREDGVGVLPHRLVHVPVVAEVAVAPLGVGLAQEPVDLFRALDGIDVIGDRELAEPLAERAEAGDVQLLVAEEQAEVVGEGPLDLREALRVQRPQVDVLDLGAQRARDRLHSDPLVIGNALHRLLLVSPRREI
jgi:hypothetical protein